MDVSGSSGSRFYSSSRHLLFGSRSPELSAEDSVGRHPPVRSQEEVLRGYAPPGQRTSLSTHVCHQSAQAS